MATTRPHRSSTAASRLPPMNNQIAELRSLADELIRASENSPPTSHVLQNQSNALRRMRQLLIESNDQTHTKDAFRHVRGFDVLLLTLRSLSGFYKPAELSTPDRIDFFEVIKATLDVLSDALNEHAGNRRFFAKRVEDGGWGALEQALGSTGVFGGQSESKRDDAGQEQLFGSLFAFALGEEAMTRIFRDIDKKVEEAQWRETSPPADGDSQAPTEIVVSSPRSIYSDTDIELDPLRGQVRAIFSGNEVLQNSDMIPTILHFWQGLSGKDAPGTRSKALSVSVLLAILEITTLSSYNKAALHVTGVLSFILPLLFENKCAPVEAGLLRELADSLVTYGINKLDDAYYLFRKAASSGQAAEFLLQGMRSSRNPPFIQFDLSLHGYSAIELPDISRPFPPVSPGGGYTFATWIRVDRFDTNCHTTLFGAYDDTQTCFLMAYLEKDTRCFILQTYMGHSTGVAPSVRFKKAPRFEEGRWYHIAVVHRRAKAIGMGTPKASLFVDGEFTETMKAHYPSHPPVLDSSQESFASISSSTSKHQILAFLGTPRNLAPRLGRNVLTSKLSMASFHLFSEPLSDELIAVYHKLGPRYCGNFQDRLGSFQTYRTSAELHVHNEILHPGREERSEIVAAIRINASHLMPESKILLSFSPSSVMDDDDRNAIDESQLIRSLSRESAKTLHKYTRMHSTPIIINAAVPSVNDALSQPRGFARLSGDPVVVVPQSLDDAIWRIGGCVAVGLKLVQSAQTLDSMLRAVKILLEAVGGNWRNCEAMEQRNGFAVLAEVLRQKIGFAMGGLVMRNPSSLDVTPEECETFVMQLLLVILRFIGYDEEHPTESLIINPLAYRVLLVDLEIWRRATSLETQKLYYSQFVQFAKGSKHHHYNAKRFHRIRVVKRLTDALKGENFTSQTFTLFLHAFKALLQINFNGENARSLSLFVTYALHDSRASYAKRTLKPRASVLRLRKGTPPTLTPGSTPRSASPAQNGMESPTLSLPDLGIAVLGLLSELLCDPQNPNEIVRFAKNVTGKWLLYLLAEPDQRVVVLGAKILARLLVVNGPHFVKKFADKTGGFTLMKNRLRHWWNTPGIWTICFAILFDRDVATIDFERDFDVFNLVDIFIMRSPQSKLRICYPEIFPVITAMLDTGLRAIVRDRDLAKAQSITPNQENGEGTVTRGRRRTMSLNAKQPTIDARGPQAERLNDYAVVLNSAVQFLSELHSRSEAFRDYANTSSYVQELLFVLYPVIVTSDSVSAETELLSRGSALTFEGQDVVIQPLSQANGQDAPVVRTSTVSVSPAPSAQRVVPFRRASSFVLVSADKKKAAKQPSLNPILSPRYTAPVALKVGSSVVEAMLEVVLDVFKDQIFTRKDFPGLGLFMKTPPGFQEHQAYFESYVLRQTLSSVKNALQLDQKLLHEPRVLTNLSRFVTHVSEAVFEGWFLDGAEPLLDFAGFLLEYLERPDISLIKSVRLCTQAIQVIRSTFMRVALLHLAEPDESEGGSNTTAVIEKMVYWQPIILSSANKESFSLQMICYLLYEKLSSEHEDVRKAAANFWRLLLVQKPHETSTILGNAIQADKKNLYDGFQKLVELDNETFLQWFDKNKQDMDTFFYGSMSKTWHDFAHDQNKRTEDTSQRRIAKRKEKLKQWQAEELATENIWNHHENSTNHWRSNIHASERIKHQRVIQDQQDNATFMATVLAKLDHQLKGPCALFEDSPPAKWRLDETESRDRKRMRIIVDNTNRDQTYQPKRKDTDPRERLRLDTTVPSISSREAVGVTPTVGPSGRPSSSTSTKDDSKNDVQSDSEDDFEMVEAMYEDDDGFEDKNRKVMRSLNRGDQVQYVCNISRVVGLEAIEGLLIVGKDCLYLLDDFFQRSDGEIVRVWQAPPDERDPYVQVIAGKEAVTNRRPPPRNQEESTRNWKWSEVISASKRRFLHRDVAIEVFFDDGRSYLLTAISAQARNDIHSRVLQRASHVANPEKFTNSEIAWRLDSLHNPQEAPQTLGSRFASAFGSVASHPATKKWLKGELSNFHYLMFVNTLAGRTFNDLTQYPVFPWVISNYESDELDLSDPSNFRDLKKPIGIQDPKQERSIRERFSSFAEMGDANHAFHYGTHYSSAMTVASYLMRLQPFSAAFFLIQGGTWDHADRMFYSIQNAWDSASNKNMADVRELTPEFFFLSDFLTNVNGYNFGLRSDNSSIDNVQLPPWAKGDPTIFITKQREALESPYVSQNLHHWIDLIFGYKQRGEAAVDAANVYHWMTYQGAIDLDSITDEKERAQKISIINNFGQTPTQVFQRPHPQKENVTKPTKLDTSAESLHRVPGTLLEAHDRISSLNYISKSDKLLCSAPFRHNIPPHYDRYMEWGFTDGSVRFYDSHSKKLIGLFEHLHSGQLATSIFADGRTLITAGTDCTLAIWNVSKGERGQIELQNATTLFGHKSPVVTLAASRAFSAFLSASLDGRVFLWDLNRSEFVRELDLGARQQRNPVPVQAARINSVTGHLVLACGHRLIVTTLNGTVLLDEDVCDSEDDVEGITAVAVYEGVGNEWCERELIFTGHRRGVVKIFQLTATSNSPSPSLNPAPNSQSGASTQWSISLINVLNHGDPTNPTPAAPITCILPMPHNVYTGDEEGRVNEPAWVQSISTPSAAGTPDNSSVVATAAQSPQLPHTALTPLLSDTAIPGCPPSLTWLFAQQLPPKFKLHSLLDAYFNNIHPIRVFAFEHKPSFIRMLDEGQLIDSSDQALLHIMCALGARFYALDYSESFAPLSKDLIQTAGSQWAKIAEEMFFADYSTISITKLKVLILLHDQEARTGNYAGSFLLTGLVIRMAHALQLNNEVSADVLCKEVGGSPNEVSVRESRRRMMWACYMIDVWAGSGVDHLTILSEKDLKIQLPCNERQYSLQIACITERLEKGEILDSIPAEDIPEKPSDNLGMAAYYVRIVSIWRRVLRFVKHMDEEQPPWLAGSGFAILIDDIQTWKRSLPPWLDFSADNIYIRRESHQLGALLLIHCMYHHVMCDVHRIALPDLFKNQEPFVFPPSQQSFVAHLQDICFEHAQRMSVLVSTILQHGVKHFADSILPSFVYNSSRIMLYYIARLLDITKPGVSTLISRTVELVQQNNKALREMTLMYPLAESLCITTERWLETVRASLARGHTVTYIAPQDPSENEARQVVGAPIPNSTSSTTARPTTTNTDINNNDNTALSVLPPIAETLNAASPPTSRLTPITYGAPASSSAPSPPPHSQDLSSIGLSALPSSPPPPPPPGAQSSEDQNNNNSMQGALYAPSSTSSFEQPMFNLDDLQNFFEWEASSGENAQSTGFEGFGPLGWVNNFSIM
ncbi:Nn.00g107940.m01.CDS01 [Neocucurbitaria sp. VM-36]